MRISDWSSDVCSSDLAAVAKMRGAQYRSVVPGNRLLMAAQAPECQRVGLGQTARRVRCRLRERVPVRERAGEIAAFGAKPSGRPLSAAWHIGLARGAFQVFIGAAGAVDVFVVGDEYRPRRGQADGRSEEHTSELQSLMRISYAVFCLKKKKN